MDLKSWLSSKKFKTAILGAIVPFVAYFLEVPQEVAYTAVASLMAAVFGFAHQDYAKAKAAAAQFPLDEIADAVAKRLSPEKNMLTEG